MWSVAGGRLSLITSACTMIGNEMLPSRMIPAKATAKARRNRTILGLETPRLAKRLQAPW